MMQPFSAILVFLRGLAVMYIMYIFNPFRVIAIVLVVLWIAWYLDKRKTEKIEEEIRKRDWERRQNECK